MRAHAAVLIVMFGLGAAAAGASDEPRVLQGVVQVAGRPAKDVVVWLDDPGPLRAPAGPVVLDQRNLEFRPRLLVITVGTTVEMPNSDRVFHNVFSFHNGKRFDLGLYPAGTRRRVTFDQPGISRVFCNIHPTMAAYVVAVPSTRFAVTDAEGRFAIAAIDSGRVGYSLWRAGADPHTGVLTASADPVTLAWP